MRHSLVNVKAVEAERLMPPKSLQLGSWHWYRLSYRYLRVLAMS